MEESVVLVPFSPLRLSYSGMKDTAKCIEVDLRMNRVYVASAAAGVFVWNFSSREPLALLEHSEWVNSVRCFPPPFNSLTQEESDELFPLQRSSLPGSSPNAVNSRTGTKYVLTASENGVIFAWCPHTFIIQARVRPGSAAITELLLAPVKNEEDRFITADGFLCYAASLRHVYVLRVTPEFQLLHDLVHEGQVLCITHFGGAFSKSLLCGQDNGCIAVWHLSSGEYEETVHYPIDAPDIEADSQCAEIHSPELDDIENLVTQTFRFNRRRSKAYRDKKLFLQRKTNKKKYIRTIALELDSFYMRDAGNNTIGFRDAVTLSGRERAPLRDSKTSLSASSSGESSTPTNARTSSSDREDCSVWDEGTHRVQGSQWGGGGPLKGEEEPQTSHGDIPSTSTFDLRRVTCLATTAGDARQSQRFYSGHGTGEVLIWEATFPDQPFLLLKKVQVFEFGSWVWNMQPLEVAREEEVLNEPFQPSPPSVLLQLCVWGDSGAVRYIQAADHVVVIEGPGFLSTCSYFIRTCKLNIRGEKEKLRTIDLRCRVAATLSSSVARQRPIVRPAAYYLLMGNFEGRIEVFDISNLVAKLRRAGQ